MVRVTSFDFDLRYTGVPILSLYRPSDINVLAHQLGVVLGVVPAGMPVLDDAEPEAIWVYLVSQSLLLNYDGNVAETMPV